ALRENIVKMCRNKFAIEQMIAENPGQADIYRKLFTKYRAQFFYEPVKNESRKHIAEMLGCSIDDIQIKSVSGNTSTALENGVTIGHDLDVTFIYKSKDGKTLIELPQAIAEDALYKTGCKKAGLNFSSMKEAKELAESLQLHACQPSDGERLPEVQKIIDKYFRTSQLSAESVPKFKNAEIYKTVPMYNEAMEALRKVAPSEPEAAALAKKLADYTSGKGTLDAACKTAINSVGNMRDTFRAAVKGGNLVKGKAVGALTVSGESGLNSRYHTIMSICDKARRGKISIPDANKSLAKMGFNVETALNEAFGMIGEVNKRLGAGSSGAVAEGVSNAARSAASASAGSYTQD
ncbi:MAG: hypothetical protein IK093_00655, partial [Ruminiclostridium sp.]|nr:hypothetical protein [Ruminiclostridium sp.]